MRTSRTFPTQKHLALRTPFSKHTAMKRQLCTIHRQTAGTGPMPWRQFFLIPRIGCIK